jgi:DNA gyrase subunit A
VISITSTGYIKALPLATYRQQHRGGVGVTGMGLKDEDFIEHLFVSSSHDYLLFFTNRGKVYRSKVYELPEAPTRSHRGRYLGNVLPLREGERVQSVLATRDFSETPYLAFATRRGLIKKTEFGLYNTPIKATASSRSTCAMTTSSWRCAACPTATTSSWSRARAARGPSRKGRSARWAATQAAYGG